MAKNAATGNWKKQEAFWGLMFLTPILLLMSIFVFYSIFFVGKISFFKWDGIDPAMMKFRGLKNYVLLFTDPVFITSIINVTIFMVLTISIQMFLAMVMALLIRPKLAGHSFFKALFYIPAALSTTIIARIFIGIYEPNFGVLNSFLKMLGIPGINWLGDPHTALYAIIAANIFQWAGGNMVFYIAGLTAIPEDCFEAAQIDGAGFWITLRKVVFPLLWPTHTTVIILGLIGAVKTFDIVWLLTQGGPGTSTQFMATYLYKMAINESKAGYGAAIGVVMIAACVGLSIMQQKIYEKTK
jgi:raffinose/stachyose/melibiose transport system permease protein